MKEIEEKDLKILKKYFPPKNTDSQKIPYDRIRRKVKKHQNDGKSNMQQRPAVIGLPVYPETFSQPEDQRTKEPPDTPNQ